MLEKANQETMRALKTNDGSAPVTAGRKVSTVEAYRKVEDIPSSRELAIMVSIAHMLRVMLVPAFGFAWQGT